jgi:superfamily II DNA or RNA helicase
MSYFSENYPLLSYPLGAPGLRMAQAGAIHSIAAHFTVHPDPALVVMPTGSGKTAVLLAVPFVLRANRVLIITPSKLVREQIVEGAEQLSVLKSSRVLPAAVAMPKVFHVTGKIANDAQWEELRKYDIVVATPNCTSPEMDGVAKAPADLFDVVLFDEAHHSAAKTWQALLDHFVGARRVLFTATPYRRDKKLIRAKSVYTYPLRKAFEDKIFGKVNFVSVQPKQGQKNDETIALKTEEQFKKDRSAGLAHVVMVRTDSKTRADELKEVYAKSTKLRLQVVHSEHSAGFVKKTIERLREGATSPAASTSPTALDGIICVNMMGEGFDFPFLKIAAVHAPHQSLAVTLQFIGRFARTSQPNIGDAHFIAVPDEIAGEAEELFHEGAVWSEIVPNLSEARVAHEQHVREVIAGFTKVKTHRVEDGDLEFDLGSIKPFCHAKIYTVEKFNGFQDEPRLTGKFEIVQHDVNEEHHCSILLLKEEIRPRWTDYQELSKVEYDFVLTYYHETSKHLFICSSRRASLALYDAIGEHYSDGTHQLLSLHEINRVLHDLQQAIVFQVGMKNSVTSSNSESYQTKMGSNLKLAVSNTDGKLYHRGHVFLKGEAKGKATTIGYSSGSKVWSSSTLRVPEIIQWCKEIGAKLMRTEKVVTGTSLDFLDVGTPIAALPENVIAVAWNDDVYKHFVEVSGDGVTPFQLHDSTLEIVESSGGKMKLKLCHLPFSASLQMSVRNGRMTLAAESDVSSLMVTRKGESSSLMAYLKEHQFHIYLSDFSRIAGASLFASNSGENAKFSPDSIRADDWKSHGVDIQREFVTGADAASDNSIHGHLKRCLVAEAAEIIIYDHGTGEIGDFLTVTEAGNDIVFSIYHCKGAGGPDVGQRVSDIYEVAGQVVKSLVWLRKPQELLEKINQRISQGSLFLKGDKALLRTMFERAKSKRLHFKIFCVQPGLSAANLAEKLTGPMGAARDYVSRSCSGEAIFWISK